ncbi:hypothetical protein BDF20DRAFT_836948 [Mycotypha africana]|uniref:uncharacterized protein n=1 Tax=Mycotypha africana TaxID=64632 RepID=UPI00230114DB|nr:uncharacterized protein BDF20DRAFT_836948 [Mycotypha africana]KAI8975561.1 hypothetical protein BDF20DRAFT_836948 [Mycotypha africana]
MYIQKYIEPLPTSNFIFMKNDVFSQDLTGWFLSLRKTNIKPEKLYHTALYLYKQIFFPFYKDLRVQKIQETSLNTTPTPFIVTLNYASFEGRIIKSVNETFSLLAKSFKNSPVIFKNNSFVWCHGRHDLPFIDMYTKTNFILSLFSRRFLLRVVDQDACHVLLCAKGRIINTGNRCAYVFLYVIVSYCKIGGFRKSRKKLNAYDLSFYPRKSMPALLFGRSLSVLCSTQSSLSAACLSQVRQLQDRKTCFTCAAVNLSLDVSID